MNDKPSNRGMDRAAGATSEILPEAQVEVTTWLPSAEQVLSREADQENLIHRPGSAEDRLKALQARLAHLEQLNSKIKHLKSETRAQQGSWDLSLSSDTDNDITFLRPRESATIRLYDSSLVSATGVGTKEQLPIDKTPIEQKNILRGDGKQPATGRRANLKFEPENARGESRNHSRDENFNPSSALEDLTCRETSALELDPAPEHSRPTPYIQTETLRKNAEQKHSTKSLHANTRSAARFKISLLNL
jgi:hypothetical protein